MCGCSRRELPHARTRSRNSSLSSVYGLHDIQLHASVGSSLGGMQSLAAAAIFPDRVARVVSISAAARSIPYSIAMRYTQRRCVLVGTAGTGRRTGGPRSTNAPNRACCLCCLPPSNPNRHPSLIPPPDRVLMSDPNWNKGDYYDGQFPFVGMKVRAVATT